MSRFLYHVIRVINLIFWRWVDEGTIATASSYCGDCETGYLDGKRRVGLGWHAGDSQEGYTFTWSDRWGCVVDRFNQDYYDRPFGARIVNFRTGTDREV